MGRLCRPTPHSSKLADKAIAVAHHKLGFKLPQCIDDDTDDNDQSTTAYDEHRVTQFCARYMGRINQVHDDLDHSRQYGDEAEEQRAHQCDALNNPMDKFLGTLARTNARNEATVALEIIREVLITDH